MSEAELVVLEVVSGTGLAEILVGLLNAQGVEATISHEALGNYAYPTVVGVLGEVQILVRRQDFDQARKILDDYNAGGYQQIVGE